MAHNKKILLDALKNLNNTKSVVKNSNLKEIPEMKKGGKFSSDIGATNRVFKKNSLFKKNPLFKSKKKKSKGKTYDPLAPRSAAPMYFDNGGIVELDGYRFKKDSSGNWTYESGAPVTDRGMIQRLTYEAKPIGSPVVQSAPKVSPQPRISSQERIQKINDLSKSPRLVDQEQATILAEEQRNVDIYNPEVTPEEKIKPKGLKDLRNLEWNINETLGFPFERAHTAAAAATEDAGEEVDNFRHPLAGRYVAEGIADATGNIPYISPALGFIGSNLLGAGHEFMTLVNPGEDVRSLLTRLSEAGEDVYNNYIGAKVGASDMTPEEKTNYLLYLSYNNKLPDGVVIEKDPKAKGPNNNLYFKKGPKDPGKYKSSYDDGGEYVELELSPEEIEEYKKGGYIVEDISVPSLNQMEEGGAPCPQGYVRVNGKCVPIHNMVMRRVDPYYTSNPNDPRIKAFNDSLDLYRQSTINHKRLQNSNMIPHIMPNAELNKSQKKAISSAKIKPKYFVKGDRTSKTPSGFKSFSFPAYPSPRQEVIYKPKPKPKGGGPGKGKKGKSKKIEPFVTSDPKEYALRNKAFNDSLRLYNAYQMQDKLMGPGSYIVSKKEAPYKWNTQELKKGRKKTYDELLKGYYAEDFQSEKDQFKRGYDGLTARKEDQELIKYYKSLGFTDKDIMYHSSPDIVSDKIRAIGTYNDGTALSPIYKKPVQPVIFKSESEVNQYPTEYKPVVNNIPQTVPEGKRIVGQEEVQQLDPKTGKVTTVINPIYETIVPPTVNSELQKFVEEREPGTGADVMPVYDTDELPMYATPDRDAQWIGDTERYVDWDGNKIPYRLPRFRKPGHGGDLIRRGKQRYIPFPSIESRYQAEIVPEEEYAMGGQYVELELTPEEIQEYVKGGFIVEDISVPSLNRMDNGGEPKGRKKERFVEGTYDPNDTAGYMLTEDEVVVPGEASAWGKARQAYKERLSEEEYVQRRKRQYLLLNPGMNRAAGVTMDRFPANVEENFRKDYRYKTNTAVVKKVGKQEGWNPNKRKEYIDDLNETQRDIVAESKYGSKLQPNYWDRALAGVATLASPFSSGIQRMMNEGYMPGLTKKESKEILNSKVFGIPMGGAEIFTPLTLQGQNLANYVKNRGLSTGSDYKELPALGSGESMANVDDTDVMGLDLPSLVSLGFAPEAGVNLLKGAYNLGKTGVQTLKTNPFSFNPTAIEGIDLAKGRAYKTLLPEAVQEQKAIASVAQAPKEPWKMQPMPGLHLKSTMTDGAISKIVEPKTGLINLDQALGIIAKESGGADKVAIIKQGLGENLPKKMDFNEFRKVVQDQLIPLDKTIVSGGMYGVDRAGFNLGSPEIKTEKIILSNKNKFGRGSDAHSNPEETLGHVHMLYYAEEPGAAIVTQVQADPFQGTHRSSMKTKEQIEFSLKRMEEHYEKMKDVYEGIIKLPDGTYQLPDGQKISKSLYENIYLGQKEAIDLTRAELKNFGQRQLLDKNHQERYLQEIVQYAAERGDINRIKLPTSETAAKIHGYHKYEPGHTIDDIDRRNMELDHIFNTYGPDSEEMRNFYNYYNEVLSRRNIGKADYSSEHKTILKKYSEQPKIIKKLYGVEPKIVTDSKGNTWYEFNIPYEFREGPAEIKAFKYGGTNSKLAKFIR